MKDQEKVHTKKKDVRSKQKQMKDTYTRTQKKGWGDCKTEIYLKRKKIQITRESKE